MASHRSSGLLFTAGLALWGGFMGEEKGVGGEKVGGGGSWMGEGEKGGGELQQTAVRGGALELASSPFHCPAHPSPPSIRAPPPSHAQLLYSRCFTTPSPPHMPPPAAAALYGPASKYAKLLYNMTNVPTWGTQYMLPSRRALWVARAGFVAPILVVMMQVREGR